MKNQALFRGTLFFLVFLLLFSFALSHLDAGQQEQGRILLEDAIRKAAVACYAAEGFYPPDVAYLQEHYGLQWDSKTYVIHYEIFASNLMPDITVLVRSYEN